MFAHYPLTKTIILSKKRDILYLVLIHSASAALQLIHKAKVQKD